MVAGLGAARRSGSNFPRARTAVLIPTGTVNDALPSGARGERWRPAPNSPGLGAARRSGSNSPRARPC